MSWMWSAKKGKNKMNVIMYDQYGRAVVIPLTEIDRVRRERWKTDSEAAMERRKMNGLITDPIAADKV